MEDEKDLELQYQEQDINGGEDNTEDVDTSTEDENKDDPKYRGKVLMQRALEQLEQGNMKEFEIDRKMANEYFDKIGEEEEELDALYNESRNFGIIYHVIEANVPKLVESCDGRKSLRKIVKEIKGNQILHEEFKAFNNLQPSEGMVNVDEYINEAIAITPNFNKKSVKEANNKLISLIKQENLDEMIDIDDDKLDLYESIEYVTMNKKTLKNIDSYINATNVIKESIKKLPLLEENKATIEDYAKGVKEITESYGDKLNSAEIKIVNEVINGNGEAYFNECKKMTLDKLNEMMSNETDMDSKSRLSVMFNKINEKSYIKENAIVDIAEMIELQNTIDE